MFVRQNEVLKSPLITDLLLICVLNSSSMLCMKLGALEVDACMFRTINSVLYYFPLSQ